MATHTPTIPSANTDKTCVVSGKLDISFSIDVINCSMIIYPIIALKR
jgi:hypothetical protein